MQSYSQYAPFNFFSSIRALEKYMSDGWNKGLSMDPPKTTRGG